MGLLSFLSLSADHHGRCRFFFLRTPRGGAHGGNGLSILGISLLQAQTVSLRNLL